MRNREKYRVVPGLSLKGPDVLARLKNRSLNIKSMESMQIESPEFAEAMRMDKIELINKMKSNEKAIEQKKSELRKNASEVQ